VVGRRIFLEKNVKEATIHDNDGRRVNDGGTGGKKGRGTIFMLRNAAKTVEWGT